MLPEGGRPGAALPEASLWFVGLDFVRERFPATSADDLETVFIIAGDSETKEALGVEGTAGESLGCAVLWLPRNVTGKE